MTIAEELQKLKDLHEKGVLTDEEFAKAKAAVLSGIHPRSAANSAETATQPLQAGGPWGCIGCLVFTVAPFVLLGLIAWASNPDQASLEKAWKEHYSRTMQKNKANLFERAAAKVLIETAVERKNFFFFSIGEIKAGIRFDDQKATGHVIGAFGNWWF